MLVGSPLRAFQWA